MCARLPRLHLVLVFIGVVLFQSGLASAQGGVIVVSREEVLREIEAVKRLTAIEEQMTGQLQSSVDTVESILAAEESELARSRPDMEPEVFEKRAQDFDRRVRTFRRETQERAAFVKRGFADAKISIVEALPEIIEEVRKREGAHVVLNRDLILATDPGLDLTKVVIALFNETGPMPPAPKIDLTRPLLPPSSDETPSDSGTDQ